MGSKSEMKEYIKSITNKYGFSFIPLRLLDDKDTGGRSGKIPAIKEWSKYCTDLPTDDDIDEWNIAGEISGVGLCCGEASNIGCIDIDTEDPELGRRLLAVMPYNAPRIIGNPKRPGKFLFKLREYPNDPILDLGGVGKTKLGNCIDVFVTGSQIVVPPSIHTAYEDGHMLKYSWYSNMQDGQFPLLDNMPVLDQDIISMLKFTLDGKAPSDIVHHVKRGTIDVNKDEAEGRFDWSVRRMSELQRLRLDPTQAVIQLVTEDLERHGEDNMVFMTKNRKTASPFINAYDGYINMLTKNNRGKPLVDCEVPYVVKRIIKEEHEGWSRPILPDIEEKIIAPFDITVVPEKWRKLVRDVGDSNSVPYEACFFILLTQLSAIIGNKKVIQFKMKQKEWNEAHNIWSIYVSRSGTRKTQLLRILSEPMKLLQKRIDDKHKEKSVNIAKLTEVVEPQIKELERRLKEEAITALDTNDNAEVIADIQIKIEQLRKSISLEPRKQLVVRSATTERLLQLIEENQTGIMLTFNELSELMAQLKKKGYETQRNVLMNSWDGLDPVSYQTKNSGDTIIDKACSAMYGAIQQSMFTKEMNEIYNGKNDDGFWQRSFIIFNDNTDELKAVDIEFDHASYYEAYDIFFKAFDLEESDEKVRASQMAYEESMEFETRILKMAGGEKVSAISSFWSKFTGKVVKIASLIDFVKNDGAFKKEVSLESFRQAMYIMERQINHIKNIFPKDRVFGLDEVIDLIQSGIITDGLSMRDLSRNHSAYFGNKESKNELIRELVERNIIKVEKEGTSTKIKISPYMF